MCGAAAPEQVLLARVRRSWGRRGELLLDLQTDWPHERFAAGRTIHLVREDGRIDAWKIRGYRETPGRALLALEGVDDIGAAQELAGAWIVARADALERLEASALRHSDLLGLEVVTQGGGLIGRVTGIEEAPHADLLRVQRSDGRIVLAPLAPAICVTVDLAARRIVLDPPEGLLDPDRAEPAAPPGPGDKGEDR